MKLITILGPTATGKTRLAAQVAFRVNGEIISADSRQVFRGMTIGTGKDYDDYIVKGTSIPCHLIDIADAGEEFSVFDFQKGFVKAFKEITAKGKQVILCGGTGLYIESVLKKYLLNEVPGNKELRDKLECCDDHELGQLLSSLKPLHNTTDTISKERMIRAIEIEYYNKKNIDILPIIPDFEPIVFGINYDRSVVKERITARLKSRLENGMIEEVESLIKRGIHPERLIFYGLEYKYITQYLIKEIDYREMFRKLNIAIHQFSKRQMTWFRKMERGGIRINWVDGGLSLEEKVEYIVREADKST